MLGLAGRTSALRPVARGAFSAFRETRPSLVPQSGHEKPLTETLNDAPFEGFPRDGRDPDAWRKALKDRGLRIVTEGDGIQDLNPHFTQSYPTAEGSREYRGYGIDSIRTFQEDVRMLHDGECTPTDLQARRPTLRQALVSTAVMDAVSRGLRGDGAWVPIPL
jgi:hypothetical protein